MSDNQKFPEFIEFILKFLKENNIQYLDSAKELEIKSNIGIIINKEKQSFDSTNIKIHNARIKDLKKEENRGVVILIITLIQKGYPAESIELEKRFPSGHRHSGYLDLYISNQEAVYMIEAKKYSELLNAADKHPEQLFNYAFEDKKTKLMSYYAYDFKNESHHFKYLLVDDQMREADDKQDMINKWNHKYLEDNFINNRDVFDASFHCKTMEHLKNIDEKDTHILFEKFTEILRINAVSDKSNAFNKIINLFLCKIIDESQEGGEFSVVDAVGARHDFKGMKFQYIHALDTAESLLTRLNDLYKEGVEQYLGTKIIDYKDADIEKLLSMHDSGDGDQLRKIIKDLRLKKSNEFAFIEVYDEASFQANFLIVRDIVEVFSLYKFRYNYKHQYLGDFFEELLNTSLKQDEGQFFTPYPLVEFIIKSIDLKKIITDKFQTKEESFIPAVIDYACGSGHFINSYISEFQSVLGDNSIQNHQKATTLVKKSLKKYLDHEYSWVTKDNVVGIDKDYRLAKTAKISTFLNGDGEADIISGDGLRKFSDFGFDSESFDILLSNPPYSVKGFSKNLERLKISKDDFSLYDKMNINERSSNIEVLFVERACQLLKTGGTAVLLLPQSFLSGDKYIEARKFLFANFKVQVMLLLADMSFVGTTTSPVVLFMKKERVKHHDYEVMTIFSEKYLDRTIKPDRERKFLGYKFSSNKNVSTTKVLDNSILKSFIEVTRDFISHGEKMSGTNKHIKYPKLTDITINDEKQVFPKYNGASCAEGIRVGDIFDVNPVYDATEDINKLSYVEISNIKNNKITPSDKKMKGRLCKKGDILLSSLTPASEKIVISDAEYILSSAIFVLSIKDEYSSRTDEIYAEIRKDYVLSQMNNMVEGFKITYAKISENNLKNNVRLVIKKSGYKQSI